MKTIGLVVAVLLVGAPVLARANQGNEEGCHTADNAERCHSADNTVSATGGTTTGNPAGTTATQAVSPVALNAAAEAPAPQSIPTLTVTQLVQMLHDKMATPVDANTAKVRTAQGIIPGARLLSSASQYDPAKELPAQKDALLVFYCANTQCAASHDAAKRAIEAGYTHVQVLPAGIMGWKSEGQKTAKSKKS